MKEIAPLVFDVFGTVVDWRSGLARDAAALLGPQVDGGAFADAWRALYSPAMEEVRSGRRPFVALDVLHRESLERVLSDFGIPSASLPPQQIDELNRAWHRLDPWPDAVQGLTRLKRRFIVAPLSNGNIALLVNMAKRAGLPWDAILGAEVSGAYKPMPEAYLRTAEILGLAPSQVCLVAAHEATWTRRPNAGCGPRSCRVRTNTARPSPKRDTAGRWDVVAQDFLELASRLGA